MKDNGVGALERELGATPPPGASALGASDLADLTAAIREAKQRQTAALAIATEQALGHIPRILRGPIRRMFS